MMVLMITRALSFFDSLLIWFYFWIPSSSCCWFLSENSYSATGSTVCWQARAGNSIYFNPDDTDPAASALSLHGLINKTPVMFFSPSIIASRLFSSTCLVYHGVGCDFVHFVL